MKIDWPEEHSWLVDLPVSKSLASHAYNLNENFCLVAATGSGKTMVLAPAIKMITGRKIILRQPTRQIAWLVYKSLNDFWGSKLKIGIRTSERSVGEFEDNDITVVTDGVMRSLLKNSNVGLTIIFDEAHWMHEPTEIELGIVKTYMNKGWDIKCVLLSATIRPQNFLEYFENLNDEKQSKEYISKICDLLLDGDIVNKAKQKQFMKCYFAEGVLFGVKKIIIHEDNDKAIFQFCKRMKDSEKRGLVFLTTRKEVSSNAIKWKKEVEIETDFCHADRNIDDVVSFVKDNSPCVLFATVSMATSATLPFDEVLVIDRGLKSEWKNGMPSLYTNVPIESNGVIQRVGRVGRTKPGVAFLNTNHRNGFDWLRQNWDKDICPEPIAPPLESLPLDMVALTCASFNLNLNQLDLLSNLSQHDLFRVARFMEEKGVIDLDSNGNVNLTILGNKINNMQMGVWAGYELCNANKDFLPALLASKVMPGPFSLFYAKDVNGTRLDGKQLWNNNNKKYKSIESFKVAVFQQAIQVPSKELYAWCEKNHIKMKSIKGAINEFKKQARRSLNMQPEKLFETLEKLNMGDVDNKMVSHLTSHGMQDMFNLRFSEKWGFNTDVNGMWAMCSKDETELLDMPYGAYVSAFASPKKITTKKGKDMIILEGITVVNYS